MALLAAAITIEDLARGLIDGLFVIDRDRRFVLFSSGCERLTGYPKEDVLGSQCQCKDITECRDAQGRSLAGSLCPSLGVFHGEAPGAVQRMKITRPDGRAVWVETSYSPICDAGGHVANVVGIMRETESLDDRYSPQRHAEDRGVKMSGRNQRDVPKKDVVLGRMYPAAPSTEVDLPVHSLDQVLSSIERGEIVAALARAKGQRTRAAKMLGISRSRLYRRMEALNIDPSLVGEPA